MIKKVVSVFIMSFIMLLIVDVKANDNCYSQRYQIRKANNSGVMYNAMPTSIKKGDTIKVKVLYELDEYSCNSDEEIHYGGFNIIFDDEAFEIMETNGHFYQNKSNFDIGMRFDDHSDYIHLDGSYGKGNLVYFSSSWKDGTPLKKSGELLELTFKVKQDAKDGIHNITMNYEEYYAILKYEIGNSKLVSEYTPTNINNGTYIIGNSMFTKEGNDQYNGILTTEYIMLASKTIDSEKAKDMIIYYKNARGKWVNAINNKEITPPSKFNITKIDLKDNYLASGVYTDSNNTIMMRLVQVDKNKAYVTIETKDEVVRAKATVNDKIISFKVDNKNYKLTIGDNELSIESIDNYISSSKLKKLTNHSALDYLYYNDAYSETYGFNNTSFYGEPEGLGGFGMSTNYLKSSHTGKYVLNNYEMYFIRQQEDYAEVVIKDKNNGKILGTYIAENEEYEKIYGGDSTLNKDYNVNKYKYSEYGEDVVDRIYFEFKNDKLIVTSPYNYLFVGTYNKEKGLSVEDVLELTEVNAVYYRVNIKTFGDDTIEDYRYIGKGYVANELLYYGEDVNEYKFVEWQVDGKKFDPKTPITKPITIIGKWDKI